MTDTELAWAAGFFDGEGWIGVVNSGKNKTVLIQAQINQVDPQVLQRFAEAVRLGQVKGPKQPRNPNAQLQWRITFSGSDAVLMISRIWDYLSPVKLKQAQRAIDAWESR